MKQLPFFVYGTLLPNQPNAYLWRGCETAVENAIFRNGRLHDLGYYPMLVKADSGTIKGQLIHTTAETYTIIQSRFDALEGFDPTYPTSSAYQRKPLEIHYPNGKTITAWAYLGHTKYVAHAPLVEDGDWATYILKQQKQNSQWWENIFTVRGLHE